ncbi:hypothetical protein [Streptomyces sp. NPDC002133]|uniref:hypothetical protein n=1 Tax=Streptomyces sp. NPDC002133 TaxID=3154409 RepID=UPI0033314EF6
MPASPAARNSVPTPTQAQAPKPKPERPKGRRGVPHQERRQEQRPHAHNPPERVPCYGTDGRADSAGDVVRWGTFCCLLVPVVLVAYGTPVGGAVATAAGLAAMTAACQVLLRRSERAATLPVRTGAHRGGGRRARNAPGD